MTKAKLISVIAAAVVADQVTKATALSLLTQGTAVPVLPGFNLTLGFNEGASFGMMGGLMAGKPLLMAALTGVLTVAFAVMAFRARHPLERAGFALVVGGALGNIIDRVRQGAVTDFLDFYWRDWHWPTFNVADIAITLGAVLILPPHFPFVAARSLFLTNTDPQSLSRDDLPLTAAFLIALAATLGALFIGEVLGQMPCTLCWYQRIAMFPLVPILGLSLWRGDGMARTYALPLVLAGLALAAWHSGLYAGILPAPIVPCTENGPSCTGEAQVILGVPIPYLSMVAFVAVLACLLLPKGQRP